MELYGSYTSPFVRHCRIALAKSGLHWSFVEADVHVAREKSPTGRVPFLVDGDLRLTDSSSILKHVREKVGVAFLESIQDFELFSIATTALDTAINAFLFERYDGLLPSESQYLGHQKSRVAKILADLETREFSTSLPLTEGELRLACFLDWALFRERITLDKGSALYAFLSLARSDPDFAATCMPTS